MIKKRQKAKSVSGSSRPVGMILCAEKGRKQVELLCLPQERIRFAEKLRKAMSVAQVELKRERGI